MPTKNVKYKTCTQCATIHKTTNKDLCGRCYKKTPRYIAYQKEYNARVIRTFKQRFNISKSKAKQRGLEWNLSFNEYKELLNLPCYYCEISLLSFTACGLDRINNDLGYNPTNVLPCCGDCNKIRQDKLTVEEMKVAMSAIISFRKTKN